jgi:hypothetical protein
MGFHGPCIGIPTRAAIARNVGNCIGVAVAHFNSSLRIKSFLSLWGILGPWRLGTSLSLAFFVVFGYRHRQVGAEGANHVGPRLTREIMSAPRTRRPLESTNHQLTAAIAAQVMMLAVVELEGARAA